MHKFILIYTYYDEPCLAFVCWADDASHAIEQCENAYPGAWIESVLCTSEKENM